MSDKLVLTLLGGQMIGILRASVILIATFTTCTSWSQGYVGGGIGRGNISFPAVTSIGAAPASSTSGTNTKGTGKLFAGYQLTPIWAVEFGYNSLGRGYSNNLATAAGSANSAAKITNVYTSFMAGVPVGHGISLLGELGLARNNSSVDIVCIGVNCTAPRSTYNWSTVAGIGAEYAFTAKYGLRLQYEDFGKASKGDPYGNGSGGAIKVKAWTVAAKATF